MSRTGVKYARKESHLRLKFVKGESKARATVNPGQWSFENGCGD